MRASREHGDTPLKTPKTMRSEYRRHYRASRSPIHQSHRIRPVSSSITRRTPGCFRTFFAAVILFVLISAGCSYILQSCTTSTAQQEEQPVHYNAKETLINQNGYDWNNLSKDTSGHYRYEIDGQTVSKLGIDVSEHQEQIDWSQVKSDGVDFAFIRLGYRGTSAGNIRLDETFQENLAEAKEAGIDRGVYFFSQAVNEDEAREEARFVLDSLNGEELEYPVAIDLEPSDSTKGSRIDSLSRKQVTDNVTAFCEVIEEAGYPMMIYGNTSDLDRIDFNRLRNYPIWFAQYGQVPDSLTAFSIWQYTEQGTVAGVSGAVDLHLQPSTTE